MPQTSRNIRWDRLLGGLIWLIIFACLCGLFVRHSQQTGGSIIVNVLLASAPPATIVARNDLPAFTILTSEKIAIRQGEKEQPPAPQDTPAIKEQEQAVAQRITLHPYAKGEQIQARDLGPRLSATHHYQIREIKASASLAWIHTGDTLALTLINTTCTSEATTPKTTPDCALQSNTSSSQLKDVVVIQSGKTSKDDVMALLLAIPLEGNADALAFLQAGGSSIVAYPAASAT